MRLERKLEPLRSLKPDIAVLSEVACPDKLRDKLPDLRGLPIVWVGDNPNKGLAVISFSGDAIALDPSYRSTHQYIAPVVVSGRKKTFHLLAVWDHNDRKEGLNRRPGPLLRALDDSTEFCCRNDLLVAGDFNNNPQWDKPDGPNNMSRIAESLMKRGLVSLYHHKTGLPFGAESHGTYWQYRRQNERYHIDYIFVPKAWLKVLVSFEIGTFEQWCGAGHSDHAPLIAEFA